METISEVFSTSPHQFQQQSRILHDSEINIRATENRFSYQCFDGQDNLQENWTKIYESEEENRCTNDDEDDSRQILKGFLKELDVKGHEMFEKLVSRVEKRVPIERGLRETLHDFKGKHGSDKLEKIRRKLNTGSGGEGFMSTERGVDGDISQDKLERFKVKTVNVIGSGVVKEEGK